MHHKCAILFTDDQHTETLGQGHFPSPVCFSRKQNFELQSQQQVTIYFCIQLHIFIQQLLDITGSMEMSLSKLWEMVKDWEGWWPAVYGVAQSRTPERLHFHFHRKEWSIVLGNTFNSGMECQGNRGPIETDTILVHVEWNAKRF